SLLGFVVARWTESLALAVALGLLAVAAPIVVGATETSGKVGVGNWVVGIAFPWLIGRAVLRQAQLAAALEATQRELTEQAMLEARGDRTGVEPGVGVALYRIAHEALANAARHAPRARTVLEVEVGEEEVTLAADTVGPVAPVPAVAGDGERRRYGVVGMRER